MVVMLITLKYIYSLSLSIYIYSNIPYFFNVWWVFFHIKFLRPEDTAESVSIGDFYA